ncbi:MAG: DeoR/GlpR transcriptional regulator [Confluentimicrobium sp.]|uniref:DeoR/GlpR family DNA-binding transcription regulator n=1 Tax=Actibacterium sp. TaxID=1872125 RepID=UPI0005101586|nr:DeoR/GlpR family DNA-binding transcription regulator [Actibacterium sp.]KGB80886.1 transcriptional regulator [Rhodovulum sp. NI22]MBC58706.1 DeoR/GlpR transcriptional regulator [Actibacterium sp.]MDY6860368.1 DeoR/GlpR family DNA-binding transcription regulator [Pseudomonadota bacterium]
MKPKQRQKRIVEFVGQHGQTSVEALARQFDVSAETIRRDLAHLAETGALQKIHGGAKRLRLHTEGSFQERMAEHFEAKQVIAGKLAVLVEPGDTLFIDTGTTTQICAEALAGVGGLTVITNSLGIATTLGRAGNGTRVFLLGGSFSGDNSETVGPIALDQIAQFQADHAVLTVAALDPVVGAMDSNFDEAQVARKMINHARNTVVVAHRAKFGRKAAFRVCRLDEINVLVCDEAPDEAFAAALDAARCDVR